MPTILIVLAPMGPAQAQENCQVFKGMLQGHLELPTGWVAEGRGVLGDVNLQHVLGGTLEGLEAATVVSEGGVGSEMNGKSRLDFGSDGTITFVIPRSLLLEPHPALPAGLVLARTWRRERSCPVPADSRKPPGRF